MTKPVRARVYLKPRRHGQRSEGQISLSVFGRAYVEIKYQVNDQVRIRIWWRLCHCLKGEA